MKRLVLISLTVLMFLVSLFPVKVSADNGKLTAEQALRILQSVNPNIANYDIETHLVTFKDGSKPVYVTPPGALTQNGEVTWDYFIEQKGDIRGWFKLPLDEISAEKERMLKESGLSVSSTTSTTSNYAYVNLAQHPQQGITLWGQIVSHSWISRLEEDFNKTFQHAVLVILTLLKKITAANIHIPRFVI